MSNTFEVDGVVLVTRDGIVGVNAEEQWCWSWERPDGVEHLVRYIPRPTGRWLRGIHVPPGGWTDYPLMHYDPDEDRAKPWSIPRDREQAEEWVTDLIHREVQ